MAKLKIAFPGIGDSLGECVLCGGTFVKEVMLGQPIATARLEYFDQELPLHHKCLDEWDARGSKDWRDLPDGPLRRCLAEDEQERGI